MTVHTVRIHAERNPHYYVAPDPSARMAYSGCAMCGYGPGAFVHNEHEMGKYIVARLFGLAYKAGEDSA